MNDCSQPRDTQRIEIVGRILTCMPHVGEWCWDQMNHGNASSEPRDVVVFDSNRWLWSPAKVRRSSGHPVVIETTSKWKLSVTQL